MSRRDLTAVARKVTAIAACAAVVLTLAACVPATTSAPTKSSAGVIISTPSPTPSQTEQAGDVSSWVIDFDRVGPARLGMTAGELTQVIPTLQTASPNATCVQRPFGAEAPLSLISAFAQGGGDPDGPFQFLSVYGGSNAYGNPAISGLPARSLFPHTALGIGIGSNKSEVLSAYPAASPVTDPLLTDESQTVYSVTGPTGSTMRFWVDSFDTVFSVDVETANASLGYCD